MSLLERAGPDPEAKAKKRCEAFNKLLADPMGSLWMYYRIGRVCVAPAPCEDADDDYVPTAQRAFLALSDRMKHDRLRFGSGDSGAISVEFTDDDLIDWRAELNPERPPSPSTAAYEVVLCKL